MSLLHPVLLLGLLALPALWWLLRALPPAPRTQSFPPLRLLYGLQSRLREAKRVPPWLLLLRLLAVFLLVLGLAGPVRDAATAAAGSESGTLLLAIDNGWQAAADWSVRMQAADDALQDAARRDRPVSLLLTAPDRNGSAPAPTAPGSASALRARLRAEVPMGWSPDRAAAAAALGAHPLRGSVLYLADGVAEPGDDRFGAQLRAVGPVDEKRGAASIVLLGRPTVSVDGLKLPLLVLPGTLARSLLLRGESANGEVLARQTVRIAAGASDAEAALALPSELRNRLARLVLEQPGGASGGAGGVRLLDEGDRRRPVGLLTSGTGSDTPLLGSLFYLRRALSPVAELREGKLDTLLSRPLSVLVAPDGTLDSEDARRRVAAFVRQGGTLIRFAGPRLAAETAAPDGDSDTPGGAPPAAPGTTPSAASSPAQDSPADHLLPVTLLGGARQLGGAMSWSRPEHPAPFGSATPFAGLAVPDDVLVSRQVLAAPAADLAAHSWARLTDGTPLVTHARLGSGQLVLFHVTSTADWSNLPLSGLFPSMLQRLVEQAVGVQTPSGDVLLQPAESLTGDGQLAPPPPSARALASDAFGRTQASATHPPGLYGPASFRRALNLADDAAPLRPETPIGVPGDLSGRRGFRSFGPWLLVAALLLLVLDLLATLILRGLLPVPRRGLGMIAPLLLVPALALSRAEPARAQPVPAPPAAAASAATGDPNGPAPGPALETRLAYVVTGDQATDAVSRQGLEGLTRYANARTSARLGEPDGVVPGRDDLAFYPMLYWPVTPQTVRAAPDPKWQQALNSFMSHGGILMIDTQGAAEGAGTENGYVPVVPGTRQALRLATTGLDIPPLTILPPNHVLNRTFYLLHGTPGRYSGAPVWVATTEDSGNDGVSPVILGADDWAAAWATDGDGGYPFATIPGGDEQRTMAYRFGVNAVIYALTGNYKADQVHVPALLKRLGQAPGQLGGDDQPADAGDPNP
ncbi:DUF4159 domain-containing protein [Acetobacteraceae bacterium KSS8]|uniref:DUF4159 domain-containing protein n=1 Tax=Endosaccharibacter trunci TaxID=2812733 RepID=A0ABT1W4F1_9PROT|nr:DUF4159 domain-containing protein [Acetobacteraceae bacterium KSS8]